MAHPAALNLQDFDTDFLSRQKQSRKRTSLDSGFKKRVNMSNQLVHNLGGDVDNSQFKL